MPPRRMVCKSFSFSSWFRPLEFASHLFRFDNVLRLRGFDAAGQQNVNGRAGSRVINPIPCADVNTHLGNALADGFAIAEVSKCRASQASQNSGLCFLVGQM